MRHAFQSCDLIISFLASVILRGFLRIQSSVFPFLFLEDRFDEAPFRDDGLETSCFSHSLDERAAVDCCGLVGVVELDCVGFHFVFLLLVDPEWDFFVGDFAFSEAFAGELVGRDNSDYREVAEVATCLVMVDWHDFVKVIFVKSSERGEDTVRAGFAFGDLVGLSGFEVEVTFGLQWVHRGASGEECV
jgi:hypothetical protein